VIFEIFFIEIILLNISYHQVCWKEQEECSVPLPQKSNLELPCLLLHPTEVQNLQVQNRLKRSEVGGSGLSSEHSVQLPASEVLSHSTTSPNKWSAASAPRPVL
jgi:hypothetical protein